MKIVVLDGYTLNPGDLSWEGIEKLGEVEIYDRTSKELVIERIADADAVLTNKVGINEEILKYCHSLKYIGVLATGYNVIDTEAAKARGITISNVPSYCTKAVAQYVFAMLLEISHHIGDHDRAVKDGEWTSCPDFSFWKHDLFELAGKTLGIIGYGRIGNETGMLAEAFGMNVLVYKRHPDYSQETERIKFTELDDLFEKSDVISLHCPMNPESAGIINTSNIEKCKDGVIIINISRGGLVVEEDMNKALRSGKVSYFAADVVSEEPIKKDNPLFSAPNTIITPHIAWAPLESRQRLLDTTVENLKAFIVGKPQNEV